jgi:putative DNA primase/helicase
MSRFEVTKLHKKLACLMGETNFTEMKQTALIKSLTGKDTISFEYKGKDPFDEENYAKIIIATNNLPTTTDKTLGWYRRWCIIDFPNTFSEKKDILGDIPDKEYEALALKCSYILKDLLEKKMFHNEGTIQERMDRYEAKSNPFDKFMEQNIEEEPNSHISKRQFFEKFKDWCNANRFRIISEVEIAKKMEERDIHSQRISMNWDGMKPDGNVPRYRAWVGITWKSKQMRG